MLGSAYNDMVGAHDPDPFQEPSQSQSDSTALSNRLGELIDRIARIYDDLRPRDELVCKGRDDTGIAHIENVNDIRSLTT